MSDLNLATFFGKCIASHKKIDRSLGHVIQYRPKNKELFRLALTHKSVVYEMGQSSPVNNERLEYLGDAVLNTVVADMLYHLYPGREEGFLTKMRSKIVSRETLNRTAKKIGLERIVRCNIDDNLRSNVMGNALEAVIGAVFLDAGFNKTRSYIRNKIIDPHIDVKDFEHLTFDYKSQLIEWSQKNDFELIFEDYEKPDDSIDNQPVFVSNVRVQDRILGCGEGTSKKEAQQKAAREAFNHCIEF